MSLITAVDLHHRIVPEEMLLLVGVLGRSVLGKSPQFCESSTREVEEVILIPPAKVCVFVGVLFVVKIISTSKVNV